MAGSIAPMTFLQLAQRLQVESDSAGAAPTTTLNASGLWQKLCNWTAQAYVDLQNHRNDWLWMERDVQFNTIAAQSTYPYDTTIFTTPASTGLADFGRWKLSSTADNDNAFRIWLASVGFINETFLSGSMDYDMFRDYYIFGSRRNTIARPVSISVTPAKALIFGFAPDDIYTVVGKYFQCPQTISVDADVPLFPAQYHMLLVWMALEQYGIFKSAPEVIARAQANGKPMLRQLETLQLEDFQQHDAVVE